MNYLMILEMILGLLKTHPQGEQHAGNILEAAAPVLSALGMPQAATVATEVGTALEGTTSQ